MKIRLRQVIGGGMILLLTTLFVNINVIESNTYRLLLYVFAAVPLLACIAFIIFKLKKATTALNAANENLELRVQARAEELSLSNTELQKSEAKNAVIFEIIQGITATSNLKELLDHIYRSIYKLLYAENYFIALYDAKTRLLDMQFFVDKYDESPPPVKLDRGLTSYVFKKGQPMLATCENIRQLIEDGEIEIVGTLPSVWLGVPLRTPSGVIGVLVVQHYEDEKAYNRRDLEFLTSVGDQIAVAIDRKRVQENMEAAVRRERAMIENALDVICTVDAEGRFISVNPACLKMWGYEPEELVGRRFMDFVTPEDVAKTIAVFADILSGDEANNFENRYVHKNGTLVDVRWTSYWSESERLTFAVAHDITERKHAEEAVQNSRDYLNRIINAVADPIFVKNRQHQMVLVNDAFCLLTKLSREDLIGRDFSDFAQSEEGRILTEIDNLVFESGKETSNQEEITDSNSNRRVQITKKTLYTNQNGEQFIVGVINDITERIKVEQVLREKEAEFRDLFDNAPVGYHELDTAGRFTRINHTEELLLGYTNDELIGRHSSEIIVEKASREETTAKLSGRMPLQAVERTFIRKDGSLVSVLNEDRLIHDKNGGVTGIRSTLQDITERKVLEEKLQRGQKLESIGQLAAGIAHEINTPTQYVGDNVRFLKDSFEDFSRVLEKNGQILEACRARNVIPELVAEMEETIERADIEYLTEEVPKSIAQALDGIGRISKIVQSMKDFAHPGSTDRKATDLNKAIESTITVASNEWKYVAEVVTEYDRNLPTVPCLIGEFNQVVLNMIVNAAHAISEVVGDGGKGKISISTKHDGDWAEIRISDTGAGIPENIRKKIFDPFFTTKEVGKGTGQGLAISHAVIVEKHKGTISVESEVARGTTFVICLPINESSEPPNSAT